MTIRLHGTIGTWTLPEGDTVMGRAEGCHIRMADRRLSRRHASFQVVDGVARVADLGSQNPVLVNGDRVMARVALVHGDAVVVGPFLLRVEVTAEPSPVRLSTTHATADPAVTALPPPPPRGVTQALDPDTLATLTTESRRAKAVDPHIAAALGRPPTRRLTDRHEADAWAAGEGSGALSTGSPASNASEPLRTQPTTAFTAPSSPVSPTSALTPGPRRRPWLRPLVGRRLAAALLDGMTLVGLSMTLAVAPIAIGVAHGAAAVGATITEDRVVLGPGGTMTWQDLVPVLLLPGGLSQLPDLITQLVGDRAAFPGLFLGLSAGALGAEAMLLWGTVGESLRCGAPWWHRALGLELVVRRNGHRLGWFRATCRWALVVALAPVTVVSIWFGGRSLHDRWCGVEVQAKNS